MLILLCAISIGQVEDVAKLRERYEKAQASYEKLEAVYDRTKASYERLLKRESTRNRVDALPAISTNPRLQTIHERLDANRTKLEQLHEQVREEQCRRLAVQLRRMEMLLLQLKRRVDELKWQYELAAGRPSEHFA